MTESLPIPEHITPRSLHDMSMDDIEKIIAGVQVRRLSAVRQYEAAQLAAKEAKDDKARITLSKQTEMMVGNIERVDKSIIALETRVNKIRVLRLELGLD